MQIFVVPGGSQALLGMPDLETLGILNEKCEHNTALMTQAKDSRENYKKIAMYKQKFKY